MSFGGGQAAPAPIPPPLPPEAPPAPQFATAAARPVVRGKPYGGTLLTSPMGGEPSAPLTKRSLIGF